MKIMMNEKWSGLSRSPVTGEMIVVEDRIGAINEETAD